MHAAVGLLLSVCALGGALYTQQVLQWFPCPLCILQRYAYLLTAVCFLLMLIRPGQVGITLLTLLLALAGGASAFYHVWVLAHPLQTCGIDPLQLKLNALPWVSVWPALFTSDGLCSDVYPPLLGLSLPAWSGLGFLGQFALALQALRCSLKQSV
ncbi:disulfide bond formation protein B [Limnobacter humi]|uniref:Disulfide bond formation protein B n=1 Tax=Limnobacter humi TaxID=1778671 RepID=A0ABT1WDJ8_9BURK|nr:disulfide bond formation protein B [Limnobacter humi]MCQ8894938.1 disulfide bond formation protein B [Limnobacter humi]